MVSTKDSARALIEMEHDVGAPEKLVMGLAPEPSGEHTEWMKMARRHDIDMHWIEKGRKNQNCHAEREIGELKR